jgi:hypothetical protein
MQFLKGKLALDIVKEEPELQIKLQIHVKDWIRATFIIFLQISQV